MKYAIDKIEDDIIVLENLDTKELKEVSSSQIVGEPHEGAIVLEQEENYIIIPEVNKTSDITQYISTDGKIAVLNSGLIG